MPEGDNKGNDGAKPPEPDKKDGGGTGAGGAGGDGGKKPSVEELHAKLEAVTHESIERRQENKALKEELAQVKPFVDALKSAFGTKDEGELTKKVEDVKAQGANKLKSVLLRAEVTAAAARAGVRDPGDAVRLLDLADVAVDVDKETVDSKALEAKLGDLKKAKPYLFSDSKNGDGAKPIEPTETPGPGRGSAGGDPSHYTRWQSLLAAGATMEAAKYLDANRVAIKPFIK